LHFHENQQGVKSGLKESEKKENGDILVEWEYQTGFRALSRCAYYF